MAWAIVRQPNDLLARFSEVVDNFTHMNLNDEEAFNLCCESMSKEDACKKLQRAYRDEIPYTSKSGTGLDRWKDALETIQFRHGDAEVLAVEEIDRTLRTMIVR